MVYQVSKHLYDQSKIGFTLMKAGHPSELGENCSCPTCKIESLQKLRHLCQKILGHDLTAETCLQYGCAFANIENQSTAVGSPIRTPRKIALIGLAFSKASKPDLKSERMISSCKP